MNPQYNRDLNQGVLHFWSKFGDSCLSGWQVITRTNLWLTDTHTHTTHTHRQAQATTILEGHNWPRVKSDLHILNTPVISSWAVLPRELFSTVITRSCACKIETMLWSRKTYKHCWITSSMLPFSSDLNTKCRHIKTRILHHVFLEVIWARSPSMMTSSDGTIFCVTGPLCVRGIHLSPVNPPYKGQWRGALMFSLICAWINGWVNTREAGDWDAIAVIMTSL